MAFCSTSIMISNSSDQGTIWTAIILNRTTVTGPTLPKSLDFDSRSSRSGESHHLSRNTCMVRELTKSNILWLIRDRAWGDKFFPTVIMRQNLFQEGIMNYQQKLPIATCLSLLSLGVISLLTSAKRRRKRWSTFRSEFIFIKMKNYSKWNK